jgi:hypothetical protein
MKNKIELIMEGPPIFDESWEWRTDEYPKPGSFDACCIQCVDYRIPRKGGQHASIIFDATLDCCVSEEIMNRNGGKPLDHGLLLKATMFTGCKYFRKKKSLEETLSLINDPENRT